MTINISKLGGGLLATGTVLLNFASQKVAWWMGLIFMVSGPILLSINSDNRKTKKKCK